MAGIHKIESPIPPDPRYKNIFVLLGIILSLVKIATHFDSYFSFIKNFP